MYNDSSNDYNSKGNATVFHASLQLIQELLLYEYLLGVYI